MATRFQKDVDAFLGDPTVLQLLDLARETRPLRICYPREVPVSRFLAWILDPTEGHGLGDLCLRSLLGEAWRRREDARLDIATRRSIAPTYVAGQTFGGCLVKREVKLAGKALDVLVLEPRRKWLLAVENKYGAGEGRNQLASYEATLKKLYPQWKRLLVFLDVFGQPPSSHAWIGLDYQWLVDEISAAEGSPWLGDDSKVALREFRSAIEPDGAEFVHVDVEDEKLLQVVDEHRTVFERMRIWSKDRAPVEKMLATLYRGRASQARRAEQQLFQVFWQRRRLWNLCLPMLQYAGLFQAVRKAYDTVVCSPKRKAFYFHLPAWEALSRDPNDFVPLFVMVRILPPKEEEGEGSFILASFVNTVRVRQDLTPAILPIIQSMRGKHLKRNRRVKDEPGRITLRVDRVAHEEDVKQLLIRHVHGLDGAFKDVLSPMVA